jgi:hypothetical protein
LIRVGSAPRATPSTSCGSRFATPEVYRRV